MGRPLVWCGGTTDLDLSSSVGVPDVVFVGGDLLERSAGDDGVWFGLGDEGVGGRALVVVVLFDQQPVWLAGG